VRDRDCGFCYLWTRKCNSKDAKSYTVYFADYFVIETVLKYADCAHDIDEFRPHTDPQES